MFIIYIVFYKETANITKHLAFIDLASSATIN